MSEVMQQIDGLRNEMAGVNQRLGGVEQRLGAVETTLHNVVVEQSRARGDIEWLKQNMATRDELKTSFSLILDRLDEHERRIAALEAKRA